MPPPSPPPPAYPPRPPGATALPLLIHTATLSGTVEAFDRIAYTAALAALLGVSTSAISLSVTAASVTVTSSIRATNNASAATMLTTLRTASISPSALTAALGNIVTVEATTPPTVTERILFAPSPPPPSPPPPSPPPSPPPQPPLPPQAPPPPDQCFVSPTHRYNISASPGCDLAKDALAGAGTDTSVCAAIALAAIEHSTLCQDSPLCKDVGFISRDDINLLYAANLADLVLEFFSTAALLLLAFPKTLGGARTGGPMLLVMLVADVALEFVVINTANRILPIITVLKDSDCLNQLLADGRTQQETLVKLEEDLEAVATLGYTELGAAAVASAGDLKDMWDEYHGKGMGSIQRMFFLFLPAVMDVLLAALDFFIFTVSAQADNEAIRESIVNRGSMWCVTITDECVTIAENEATRLGIDRPIYNGHTGLWIGFVSAVPAISVLYFMYICVSRERAPETTPSQRRRAGGLSKYSRRTLERELEMRNQQQHTADAI